MSGLELALAAAALLIGATGSFSPCGFSVIETLGPTGHTGGRPVTVAACATFLPGAVLGGLLTFGALALLGEGLHGAGATAYVVAAVIAAAAAVLEARGTRIVPQIRRQLPEHWRRLMPMPLAAALYGVLLGLGFTTFVLSFGVWALAGISLALGDPDLGLLIGAAFGVGRALPVVVLAPLAGTDAGARVTDLMAGDPAVYLGVRRGDAAALAVAALALSLSVGDAGASGRAASSAADPSATVDSLAFERIGGGGVLLPADAAEQSLPGGDPALGGPYVATLDQGVVTLLDRAGLAPVAQLPAPGADALAVSQDWLAYRARLDGGGDGVFAHSISDPAAPGPLLSVARVGAPAQLSPPSLDGAVLLYGVARPKGSSIVQRVLGTRKRRLLVRARRALVFNPAVKGRSFAYVRSDGRRSRLMVRRRAKGGAGKLAFAVPRRRGLLTSVALTEGLAYVTLLHPSATGAGAEVLKVGLKTKRKGKKKKKKR